VEFGETDPQEAAEQETAQATPLLPESLATVAVNAASLLSCTVAVGFETVTRIAGGGGITELLPQPKVPAAATAAPKTPTKRVIFFGDIKASYSDVWIFFQNAPCQESIHAPG
jgi:hypothetical protein